MISSKLSLWRNKKNLAFIYFSLGQSWGQNVAWIPASVAGCFGIPPPTNWSQVFNAIISLTFPSQLLSVFLSLAPSQTSSLASYKAVQYDGAPLYTHRLSWRKKKSSDTRNCVVPNYWFGSHLQCSSLYYTVPHSCHFPFLPIHPLLTCL